MIVNGMVANLSPERGSKFIYWFFPLLGHDDREMWTRVMMGLKPEQVFAGMKLLIRDVIPNDCAGLPRRIPVRPLA